MLTPTPEQRAESLIYKWRLDDVALADLTLPEPEPFDMQRDIAEQIRQAVGQTLQHAKDTIRDMLRQAVAAERERCAKIVEHRAGLRLDNAEVAFFGGDFDQAEFHSHMREAYLNIAREIREAKLAQEGK